MAASLNAQLKRAGVARVAVLEFASIQGDKTRLGGNIGAAGKLFAGVTETRLVKESGGRHQVVDRARVKEVLAEVKLQLTDLVDRQSLQRLRMIEPVDALITGTVFRAGPKVYVTVKALGVPGAVNRGMETGRVSVTPDLAALFGESYYLAPDVEGKPARPEQVVSEVSRKNRANPMADPLSAIPYGVAVLVDGKPLAFHRKGHDLFVPATPGKTYVIRLANRSDRTVAVALLVDGLSTVGQERVLPADARKWVVEPGKRVDIRGWQKTSQAASEFVFTPASESLAARRNFLDDVGLITAVFYAARKAGEGIGTRGLVGTGEGKRIRSRIKTVHLDYHKVPAAVLNVHYDLPKVVEKLPKVRVGAAGNH